MKKRLPLSSRLVITMLLLVAGTIGLCWILNNTFLEDYYVLNKEKELLSGFNTINRACTDGILETGDFDVPFEKICTNGNINIMILREGELLQENFVVRSSFNNAQLLEMQIGDFLYGPNQQEPQILRTTDNYVIERQTDSRMQAEYLILAGTLDDEETFIYMKTALESIRESAQITNRFFLMIGGIALIICVFVIIIAARSISKPLKELTSISRKMTDLDFDAKYHPRRNSSRELDALGNHMNELSDTLEKTISELKTANNELQQDIEKKEQIDEMRKEFLSNVSHELKTPLALIQGYAEGLQDGITEDPESMEFYCDVIVDEAEKMNRMVQKLLTLNQLEFGNDVVDMSRFDITELVQGVINASALLASSEGVEIGFSEKYPVYVWGDEFKVEEVITNFLSNAIHYALGEKRIMISFEERGKLLRVSVFNTGDPIPEEDIDKVWIKFYKVDKARTREYGGSGIGLSIVKAIMDSFHQKCGVANREDGVEFWMELERAGNSGTGLEDFSNK